ncbi:MAG: glycosyltransferase family 2 protein [Rickettsiales bacterium]|jgi:glycosyltransferase involved in cell wall biosynthesis|nr:glycosyltransferase family 2 protein [Rickettsiales bacterium]
MEEKIKHIPDLTIIIPAYNESDALEGLFLKLLPILDSLKLDWRVLCVDDGSKDDTREKLRQWHDKEPRIQLLALSRNFGKEAALTAGLFHAEGQAVIPFDADLQDPPELIPEMVAKWREGYKVVLAVRRNRNGDGWLKRISALCYYKLMRAMHVDLPANVGDFRLMDRQVVEVMRLLPERTRFMKGLFAWVGFSTASIYFDRPERAVGEAKQSLRSLLRLAKDGIFSFTTLPLRLATYLGIFISAVSFSYAAWLILRTLIFGVEVPGYISIMAAVLCMGGIQLISLGIIGEYIGRIYRETKQRPLFVVEEHLR